jgi:hypothetical protein
LNTCEGDVNMISKRMVASFSESFSTQDSNLDFTKANTFQV